MVMSVNFIYFILIYLFYFKQGRSENHFCENAPCLKMMMIIIIMIISNHLLLLIGLKLLCQRMSCGFYVSENG